MKLRSKSGMFYLDKMHSLLVLKPCAMTEMVNRQLDRLKSLTIFVCFCCGPPGMNHRQRFLDPSNNVRKVIQNIDSNCI